MMQTIKNANNIKLMDTKVCVDIDVMYGIMHDDVHDNDNYDRDVVLTDLPCADFHTALNDTTQNMLCFLDTNDLSIDTETNCVTFDIASFHIIRRMMNHLTVEYETNVFDSEIDVFPDHADSYSYRFQCDHDDHYDFNISIIEMILDLLSDFYYHEFNINHIMS